jgi:hypothetical protein
MLGGLPDKARVSRGGRVHAKRVKAKLPEAVDQSAIAAPDVEDREPGGRAAATPASKSFHHWEPVMGQDHTPCLPAGPGGAVARQSRLHRAWCLRA